jgi:uncharacterized protein
MESDDPGSELAGVTAWLLDTGPLVAYLDARDPAHPRVTRSWDGFTGRLLTTSAVVTEAMHLVSRSPSGPRLLAELTLASDLVVYDLTQPRELRAAAALMERYGDAPMDFADATLVLLAEVLELNEILTLDRRGFSTYRIGGGKGFRLVMDLE